MTHSIQTEQNLIAGEDCAVMTRVITGIELLYPLGMRFLVMYDDPITPPVQVSDPIRKGPVGELLLHLGRHNMRPNHLHVTIEAPGYRKLVTALYVRGDKWISSDAVFGVKGSLVVVRTLVFGDQDWVLTIGQDLKDVDNEEEARRRGFPKGKTFKLLQHDFVLVESEEAEAARQKFAAERAKNVQ